MSICKRCGIIRVSAVGRSVPMSGTSNGTIPKGSRAVFAMRCCCRAKRSPFLALGHVFVASIAVVKGARGYHRRPHLLLADAVMVAVVAGGSYRVIAGRWTRRRCLRGLVGWLSCGRAASGAIMAKMGCCEGLPVNLRDS